MEFSSLLEIIIIISSVLSVVHKHEAVLFPPNNWSTCVAGFMTDTHLLPVSNVWHVPIEMPIWGIW